MYISNIMFLALIGRIFSLLGAFVHALLKRANTLALARFSRTVGRHAAACLCRTWARLGLMSSGCLLCCCSSGLAQMMTSHTDVFRNISRNTEKMLSLIHTQKGFDFWGTKSHHSPLAPELPLVCMHEIGSMIQSWPKMRLWQRVLGKQSSRITQCERTSTR